MSQKPLYRIRPLVPADQALLWEMLYLSLFVTEGQAPFEREILQQPDISKYVCDWGGSTDSGFVAVDENDDPVGAIWLRLLPGSKKGYGYVDDATPELGMAVIAAHRNQGIGTTLLERLVDSAATSYEQISLSVAAGNPARRLYERFGFEVVGKSGNSFTMRKKLSGCI
jgi:ribosomal protein S18 acetylase RimI-like enzyme